MPIDGSADEDINIQGFEAYVDEEDDEYEEDEEQENSQGWIKLPTHQLF